MKLHYPPLRYISECFLKPESELLPPKSKQPLYLNPSDLAMLSGHYIQKGLLFQKPPPPGDHPHNFISDLQTSLSAALLHFYPLSGRLASATNHQQPSVSVYIDCINRPGAKFVHAAVDCTISDVLSPADVPLVVQSFFDLDRAVNYDGHTLPLLSIQVTELLDGIFIGCSMNHAVADGTSYWNFFNTWSEIFQSPSNPIPISRSPVLERWIPDGCDPIVSLPFTDPDQFISRFEAPKLRERMFHFSAESIAKLKAKANTDCGIKEIEISSFQSLSALVWRSITRARGLTENQPTMCMMAANNRARLEPPLSGNYFGNAVSVVKAEAKTGELLERELGWAALELHNGVKNQTNKNLRELLEQWLKCPNTIRLDRFFNPNTVMMGSSPRFNMYGNEFGMGKAVALRSGYANKFDGKVSSFPGYEGGGSVDLEICLSPENMAVLESDLEFISVVSSSI